MLLNTELRARAHRERSRQREKRVSSSAAAGKPLIIVAKNQSMNSNSEWSLIMGGSSGESGTPASGSGGMNEGSLQDAARIEDQHAGMEGGGGSSSNGEGQNGGGTPSVNDENGGAANEKRKVEHRRVINSTLFNEPLRPKTATAASQNARPPRTHVRPLYNRRRSTNSMTGVAVASLASATSDRRAPASSQQLRKQSSSIEGPTIHIPLRGSGSSAASNPPSSSSYRKCAPEGFDMRRTSASSTASEVRPPTSSPDVLKQSQGLSALQGGAESGPVQTARSVPPSSAYYQTEVSAPDLPPRQTTSGSATPFGPLFDGIMSRIESPPKMDERNDEPLQFSRSAIFMKHYYEVVEKCRSWQRYGNALRAKAETLEVESSFARSALQQRDADIRALESQNDALRRAIIVLEDEIRRYKNTTTGDSRFAPSCDAAHRGQTSTAPSPHSLDHVPANDIEERMAPLAPFPQHQLMTRRSQPLVPSQPMTNTFEQPLDLRAPTPLLDVLPTASWQQMMPRQHHFTIDATDRHATQENVHCENQHTVQHSAPQQPSHQYGDATERVQLTSAALAAINKQSEGGVVFPNQTKQHEPLMTSDWAAAAHSAGQNHATSAMHAHPPAARITQHSSSVDLGAPKAMQSDRRRISLSMIEAQAQAQALATANASQSALSLPWDASQVTRGGRCDSGHSDALTVTEDYLNGIMQNKRQLRKVSQNQQQQLHYLQARVQRNSTASRSSHGSSGDFAKVLSRPASRLSSHGAARGRGRNNSISVETIPVQKDDVFSKSKSSERLPLQSIDANVVRPASALGLRNVGEQSLPDERTIIEKTSPAHIVQSPQQEATLSPSERNHDPKGAHRRLYMRLRNELSTPDIMRFERYVHRYDALEIGIEGSRGIVNRVRRLLLPEDIVKAKSTQPERYRFRKDLAREFERIVREDAVPLERDDNGASASRSTDGVVHCTSESETTFDDS